MDKHEVSEFMNRLMRGYPHPTCSTEQVGGYCVGGAFVATVSGGGAGYPEDTALAKAIRTQNKALGGMDAYWFAEQIIDTNDSGLINEAWEWLEAALLSQGEGTE